MTCGITDDLFIYYTVYTHVKSFTIVKNCKCGQVTSHCRKARLRTYTLANMAPITFRSYCWLSYSRTPTNYTVY